MLSQEGLRRLFHHAGIRRERQPCSSPGLCKGSAPTEAGVTGGITRSQPRGLVGQSHFGKSTIIRDRTPQSAPRFFRSSSQIFWEPKRAPPPERTTNE